MKSTPVFLAKSCHAVVSRSKTGEHVNFRA